MDIEEFSNLMDSKIAFTTPDGDFEGILKLILIQAERVTFEHVFLLPSRNYLGTMHILFSDISSCTLVEPPCKILDSTKFDSSKELLNGSLTRNFTIDETEIVEIDPEKHFFDYLPSFLQGKSPTDYCIINSLSETFCKAIDHLSQLSIIGVAFHGPKVSRNGNLSWVCISSSACVFLFDIEQLGVEAFSEGLQRIFEDEEIEKVIHDCRYAADCLLHMFQTNLKNIFDTQVADFLINMQMYTGKAVFKYVSSLDSCLVKYLKVPQQFLYNHNKCLSFDNEVKFFQMRPISKEFTNVLVKSSMYLILLKKVQEDFLLYPFEQTVQLYLNVVREASDSEVYRASTKSAQSAPAYLIEAIKPVRFSDASETLGNFMSMLNLIHKGKEEKCQNSECGDSN